MFSIGEVFHLDPKVIGYFFGGSERHGVDTKLDHLFDFPLYGAVRSIAAGRVDAESNRADPQKNRRADLRLVADSLRADSEYVDPTRLITVVGNHDVVRLASACDQEPWKIELLTALTLSMRGTPQLYQGDEIGLSGGEDPDNRRRFPGGFFSDPVSAFNAVGRTKQAESIRSTIRTWLALRKTSPVWSRGATEILYVDESTLVIERSLAEERVLVVAELERNPPSVTIEVAGANGKRFKSLIGSSAIKPASNEPSRYSLKPAERSVSAISIVD
jgi:glycosidase